MAMNGWSDIYALDATTEEDAKGFNESSERVNTILQKEIDSGILPENNVLAGFSQGGALALHTALRSKFKLGGCAALSTWLPFRNQYPKVPHITKLNYISSLKSHPFH